MTKPSSIRPSSVWLFAFLIASVPLGCAKQTKPVQPHGNYAPEIRAMAYNPSIVHAWQVISVQCTTRDLDGDPLAYTWFASSGSFTGGNQQVSVAWRSPASQRPDTLKVSVTDGKDHVSRDTTVTITRMAPAESLRYTNGSNLVDLVWQPTVDEGLDGFDGYEVFVAGHSFEGMPEESLPHYLLTPSPINRLQYRDLTAVQGEKRYYSIRARRDYAGVIERSATGPEIDTASRPDGFGDALYEIASTHGAFGVQLRTGRQFPIDIAFRDSIDLYLGTPGNDGGGAPYLKSPNLLAYRDPAWGLRVTLFQPLRDGWNAASPASDVPWADSLTATVGSVCAVQTADGHFGKFRILEFSASPPERRIQFQWAWQPLREYPRF